MNVSLPVFRYAHDILQAHKYTINIVFRQYSTVPFVIYNLNIIKCIILKRFSPKKTPSVKLATGQRLCGNTI